MRFIRKLSSYLTCTLLIAGCSQLLPPKPSSTTNSTPVYGISILSGNNQSAPAGTELPKSLVVLVSDKSSGSVLSNVGITWSVLSGGGSFISQYTSTDPLGHVPTDFRIGAVAGVNTVKASLSSGDSVTFTLTGVVGSASAVNSSIVGSGPIEPDGVAYSAVTITLKDSAGNPISGSIPTFHASGSNNVVTTCSSSNASGISTCQLRSTTGETKTLILDTPVIMPGSTVVFAPGATDAAHSSIAATGPVIANGVATSTVTITLKDSNNAAVGGVVPSFSATDTSAKNTYGVCSTSNPSTGVSTCTFTSTHAESKTVSLTAPVNVSGNTVVFSAGSPSSATSTITGTGPVEPDGITTSTVTVTLKDANGNLISGTTPHFTATDTGSTNSYGACSATNASGISTCTLTSTTPETKTLSLTSPVSVTGGTVVFAPGTVVAAHSSISASGPVIANGVSTSTVTITLKDASNIAVSGIVPGFSATDTGGTNVYGLCSSTNASGVSTCTFTSTKAETKTLSITSPISLTSGTVVFAAGPAGNPSTITGTGPVVADGVSTSTVTITLLDAFNNPVSGTTPTFSATDTGSHNSYGACSSSNASGVSTCTMNSTKAELKTLALVSPVALPGGTVSFTHGSPSIVTSSIIGSSPVEPDGTSHSSVIITLMDQYANPVNGVTPTFSATNTGATNSYGACSVSDASGVSNCALASTHPEVKTLSLLTPISMSGGTVTFVAGAASSSNSSITGTTNIIANGVATSTVTIVLKDSANLPLIGTVPTFNATNSGNTNSYSSCSATDGTGTSTCAFTSTKAEVKTLSLVSPIGMSGGTVTFVHGNPSTATSQITGTGPVLADGAATSNATIILYDAFNNPISGTVPNLSATDTSGGNVYGSCSSTSATGVSTCTFTSTHAEVKTLAIASPISMNGGTVVFTAGAISASTSTITGTSPVAADGAASSIITVTLLDVNHNPVAGTVPTFSATNTGSTNIYGTCSSSNASGVSSCTLKSTKAETKTLSISTPVSVTGGTVTFTGATPVAVNSSITGTGSVAADGTSTSTVTITLKDANNNFVQGVVPTFSATDTGSTNLYGACSSSNASGASNCTLKSNKAETKTLSITSPISLTGGTVVFTQVASPTYSTITGTGPVLANGTATSTITITLKDSSNTAMAGVTPTFVATDTGSHNTYAACSATNGSGVSTCTLKSTQAETKSLSIATPISMAGGTAVSFTQVASSTYTTITGTGPVAADGTSTSTISVSLKDYVNVAIVGVVPTFSATNTGTTNVYGACSSSNSFGVSTCTLASAKGETKTLSLVTPIAMSGGTVVFNTNASASFSSITGTGPVLANGVATSTVTITLKDSSNTAIAGVVPTFTATNTNTTNVYGTCSSTNASGVSTCTLASSAGEVKTLSIATPIVMAGGNVTFTQVALAANSDIVGSGPVSADGSSSSTVTITIKDYANLGIPGVIPTFSATNTGTTNSYGTCSSTDATGTSTCTLKSTQVETKTLSLVTPVAKSGGTVVFAQAASPVNTTITGTGPVVANGTSTSTVTITLKDYANAAIVGIVPTFTATNTGAGNTYGTCSSTNASGVSTCTLKSLNGEVKTLSLTSPIAMTGGTVQFTQAASATYSSITGTGPVNADGISTSTITITLKDYANVAIAGVVPTFTATNTSTLNIYGACSTSNASGVSTCTLKSSKGETKVLSLATPVALTGASVVFSALAYSGNTTITGTGPVVANGTSTSTVTITLKDYSNTAIAGVVPTFTATDTGSLNTYGPCSSTNASGVSTCTLKSTNAEVKTLSLSSPITMNGGTVQFTQAAYSLYTTITGSGPVAADGTSSSSVTVTLKDYANLPISGVIPTFTATNTSSLNIYGTCSTSNASGVATCALKSTKAETKVLSLATPIAFAGGSVVFTQAASTTNSTITGTGPVTSDGVSASTITITLKDYANAAIPGVTPTFTATDTGSTNSYGACSITNASGVSTCTLKSTQAETKTLSGAIPIVFTGSTVVFN